MSTNLMDSFQKMSLGEKIVLIAGPILLIDSFLPWYKITVDFGLGSVSASASGWEAPGAMWSILAVLIGLVMAGQVAVSRFTSIELPSELGNNLTWPKIHLGLGVAAVVFVAIKFLNESSHLSFGFFLGIILVIALAAGGFLMFQEEQKGGASGAM